MDKMARSVVTASERIAHYQSAAARCVIVGIVMVLTYAVVMRYVFRQGIGWTFEAPTFGFFIVNALGLAYVQLNHKHLSVDVAVMKLPQKWKHIANACANMMFVLYCLLLLYTASRQIPYDWVVRSDQARLPIVLLDIILCISLLALILQLIIDICKELAPPGRQAESV